MFSCLLLDVQPCYLCWSYYIQVVNVVCLQVYCVNRYLLSSVVHGLRVVMRGLWNFLLSSNCLRCIYMCVYMCMFCELLEEVFDSIDWSYRQLWTSWWGARIQILVLCKNSMDSEQLSHPLSSSFYFLNFSNTMCLNDYVSLFNCPCHLCLISCKESIDDCKGLTQEPTDLHCCKRWHMLKNVPT